ncbi:unnamed protein product [Aphanomyces euteiches]|nr:hypothetical protein Ae201684P_014068 [Aphanomyces euteiches]KAH9137333.1 hypothetical protein AeRB84_017883 [Aphanomyces euteiches]
MLSWDVQKERIFRALDVPFASPVHPKSYHSSQDDVTLVKVCTEDGHEWLVYIDSTKQRRDSSESASTLDEDFNHKSTISPLEHTEIHSTMPDDMSTTTLEAFLDRFYRAVESLESAASTMEPVHPSIAPLHSVITSTDGSVYVMCPMPKSSLHDISLQQRQKQEEMTFEMGLQFRFLIYQILLAAHHATPLFQQQLTPRHFVFDGFTLKLAPFVSLPAALPPSPRSLTERWCSGEVSNLEYLMALNAAAGRTMASNTSHAIVPWVTDFTSEHSLRDFTKTKFRLTKGDAQLDQMYSQTGYHVPENLTDLSVAIYMARALPRSILQRVVRSNFEPKEYPVSMARMFEWSPDECIPEFFLDPSVFTSIHKDMESVELPTWCSTPDAFIAFHRRVLESDAVSTALHQWIDLNFGVGLAGSKAMQSKNVTHRGFYQLFSYPHPIKRVGSPTRSLSSPEVGAVSPVVVFDEDYFALKQTKQSPKTNFDSTKVFGMRYAPLLEPCYNLDNDVRFSLGCIIAEIFLAKPLFSLQSLEYYVNNTQAVSNSTLLQANAMPSTVQQLVAGLVNPDRKLRPSIEDLLQIQNNKRVTHTSQSYLFPAYFTNVYEYLMLVTCDDWIERTEKLLEGSFPPEGFTLISSCVSVLLAKSTPVQAYESLVRLVPLLFHLLDSNKLREFVQGPILTLYESVDDNDGLRVCLISPQGMLGILWDQLGSCFVLKHILPILFDWLRQGSPLVQCATAHALGQLASCEMMGPSIGANDLLPQLLDIARKFKLKITKPLPKLLPPYAVGRAIVRLCSELHPTVVHTSAIPTLFIYVRQSLIDVNRQPPVYMTAEKYQLFMFLKTIRQLFAFLTPALASLHIPSLLRLLTLTKTCDSLTLSSLVHTTLRIAQIVGTDMTKQELCQPLRLFLVRFPEAQFPSYMQQFQHLLGFEHFDTCLGLPWSLSSATPSKIPIVKIPLPAMTLLTPKMAKVVVSMRSQLSPHTLKKHGPPSWTCATQLWPPTTGGDVLHELMAHDSRVRAFAVVDDFRWLLSSSGDGLVRLWRACDLQLVWQLRFKWPVYVLSAYARQQCVICDAQSVYLYDVTTRECKWQWKKPAQPLVAIHASPSGTLVVATADTVTLMDPKHGASSKAAVEWTVRGCVTCVSELYGYVAVGALSGQVALLNRGTGGIHCTWKGHDAKVVMVQAVSPTLFLTVGADKLAVLWRWPELQIVTAITNLPEKIEASQIDCNSRPDGSVWLVIGHGTRLATMCLSPQPPTGRRTKLVWLEAKSRQLIQAVVVLQHCVVVGTDEGKLHVCV